MTNTPISAEEFDFIVVGAGSSGCVLADRLSADGHHTVLLVEEGGENHTELVNMPRAFMLMWGNPKYFWNFPVKARTGDVSREPWFYGRGLGGSSSTNGTWYMRGEPADYEAWREMGLQEWAWPEVERCYREMECYAEADRHPSRGTSGPLQLSKLPFRSRFLDAAIKAAEQSGLPFLADINAPGKKGIGYSQASVDRRGRRASAYRRFLKPAMSRPNLTVLTDALVESVRFEGLRATGIALRQNGITWTKSARREVILCAGVMQSPKLLQLSGIGPSDLLKRHGLPVVLDQPAVGQNLVDHVTFSLAFRMKGFKGVNHQFSGWRILRHLAEYYLLRQGMMAFTCPELTAMFSMGVGDDWPNVQIGIGPFSMRSSEELKADPGRGALESEPGYTLNGYYLRPKSRGSLAIQSADIADPVIVEADLWSDPHDRAGLIKMVRLMREYAAQPAIRAFTVAEITPGPGYQTDEEIGHALDWLAGPGLHATGTCRMGPDACSVLDARLRVRGVEGLRVADCSAMPTPPSGNTNAPAMMLGYRAAELILEDHPAR